MPVATHIPPNKGIFAPVQGVGKGFGVLRRKQRHGNSRRQERKQAAHEASTQRSSLQVVLNVYKKMETNIALRRNCQRLL